MFKVKCIFKVVYKCYGYLEPPTLLAALPVDVSPC